MLTWRGHPQCSGADGGADLPRGGGGGGEESGEDRAEVLQVLCVHAPLQRLLQCTNTHTHFLTIENKGFLSGYAHHL